MGILVNNKQKVKQAMVKILRGALARYVNRNGLAIGGLSLNKIMISHCSLVRQTLFLW